MYNTPIIRACMKVDEHLLGMCTATERQRRVEDIKHELASILMDQLRDKMTIEKIPDVSDPTTTYVASIVGMGIDDWKANYGSSYTRRGIADGTMAIMQNGNWHIVSNAHPPIQPTWRDPVAYEPKKVEAKPAKPQPFDPSEYLKNKVNELRS